MKLQLCLVALMLCAFTSSSQPVVQVLKTDKLDNRLLMEFIIQVDGNTIYKGRKLSDIGWRPQFSNKENVSASVAGAIQMLPEKHHALIVKYIAGGDTSTAVVSDKEKPFQDYLKNLYSMDSPPIELIYAERKREEKPVKELEFIQMEENLQTDTLRVQKLESTVPPKGVKIKKLR